MVRHATAIAALLLTAHAAMAQTRPMVELGDGKGTSYQGRVEQLDKKTVTLMKRDGSMVQLNRAALKDYKTVAKKFQPFSKGEMVAQLREELGRGFSVQTTQHYVVCTPGRSSSNYAAIFENVLKAFHYQFRRRQFHLKRSEFPLVAIVFPNFQDFAKYAAKDGVRASRGLLGYYHRLTNRVAVYESKQTALQTDDEPKTGMLSTGTTADANVVLFDTGSGSDLESTITHEGIHQVGFNTGIHPRLGLAPRWIIEGLAMTFESPGFLSTSPARGASRINRSRYSWFQGYSQQVRPRKSLKAFIESDRLFSTGALHAYSQGWALTFFFMDQPSRSYKFGRYIRAMNAKDLTTYSAKDRLKDFEAAFGDVERVETDFLRFMKQLDPNAVATR